MKKIFIIVVGLLTLIACTKKKSTTSITPVTPIADTISEWYTVIDNGATYTDTARYNAYYTYGGYYPYSCTIYKQFYNSTISIEILSPPGSLPISIIINNAVGNINGLGIYKIINDTADCEFFETFNGGENYLVDSAIVNISYQAEDTVIGSFQMWLRNGSGNKTATGNFHFNDANITH